MRRALVVLLAALGLAASARAQHADIDTSKVPDVPSGPARLVGTIVDADGAKPVGGVEVLLYALPSGGTPGLRRTKADAKGHFVFEGISNTPSTAYLIGARYAGIPFPGERISFAADETEKQVSVRVGEPTSDASKVSVPESTIELAWSGGRLGLHETYRFQNAGDQTVYVPADRRAGAAPIFRTELPAGALDFQTPLGIEPEGLVRDGASLRFYGPLYPSSWPGPLAQRQELSFQYALPAPSGKLTVEKPFPTGAHRLIVLVPTLGPTIEVVGAHEEKPDAAQPTDADHPRRLVIDSIPPGGRLTLHVEVPPSRVDPDAVHLEETRLFLELDDAALQVQEEHVLRVDGETPVVAPNGGVLLSIPVPQGARNVRFDRDAFALGIAPDDGGGAVLRGPIPPGETHLQIAYELPVTSADGSIRLDKRFGRTVPLLDVFIADTGLRVESERLHRRRPVRTTDRTYLALEGFQVEPSETVSVSLAPLAAPAQVPRVALFGLVAVVAGIVVSFVAAPLRSGGGAASAVADDAELEDAARREREAVYVALRDLDHDHETGKLSEADYDSMRAELRARAAALLRAERAQVARPSPMRGRIAASAVPAAVACSACGAESRAGDRFCSRCGAATEVPPASGCSACGADSHPGDRFCSQCGAALGGAVEASA
jgi:cytochrome c-type biogenesis protein CcmI